MRIGLIVDNTQTLDGQLQQIVQAEQDGFDSCWSLHFLQAAFDSLTLIALAGQRTERIEMGTAVIPVYAFHPVALARNALTAQVACNGRLTLGLGASHRPAVENVLGLSHDHPARHMREFLAVLLALVRQGQVDFSGEVFRVKSTFRSVDAPTFPVMIAALAPAMLKLAGEVADGTITWMAGPKTLETHIVPRLQEAAAAAGRGPLRVCAALPVCVTNDVNETRARAGQQFYNYGQMANYRRLLDIEGVAGPGDIAIVGSEAEVEQQLRHLAAIGVTDFAAIIFPGEDDMAASKARTWELLKKLVGRVN
ncbi:MAG: TIGR03564 family F420-dependent LLM class oxidoreductase [Anaerolineae bacterium]